MQALDRLLARFRHPTKVWVQLVSGGSITGIYNSGVTVRLVGPMSHFAAEQYIAVVGGGLYRFPGKGTQRIVSARIVPVKS